MHLLDHCDLALALAPEGEPVMVSVERVKQLILDDFGGDIRAVQPVVSAGG